MLETEVNMTRSGIMRLPEQMPLDEEKERERRAKNSVNEILSEEFKRLIDGVDNYLILMTEDFRTARLIFAHALNYETNILPELAFLGYNYARSKGKKAEIWVQESEADAFIDKYREFMRSFKDKFYEPKIVRCNSWQKSSCEVINYRWNNQRTHKVNSSRLRTDGKDS